MFETTKKYTLDYIVGAVFSKLLGSTEYWLIIKSYFKDYISKFAYTFLPEKLNEKEKRAISELKKNGIFITSLQDVGFDENMIEGFFQKSQLDINNIDKEKSAYKDKIGRSKIKDFLFQLLGSTGKVYFNSPDDVYFKIASHPFFRKVANDYMKTYSKIREINLWLNIPQEEAPKTSQLWHRDLDNNPNIRIVKIFILLEPVTMGNGPFHYIPETHMGGAKQHIKPEFFIENKSAKRITDEAMEKIVPSSEWLFGTGPAGTVIMVDTALGYHKGGFVKENRRFMFYTMYAPWRAHFLGDKLRFSQKVKKTKLPRSTKWAIS